MNKAYIIDLTERVLATFTGAATASLALAGTEILHVSVWEGAALAGSAAVISLLKGLAARYLGDDSAGLK